MSENDERMGPERRAAPRIETGPIEGTMAGKGGELRCRISNLSRLGACAVSSVAMSEMTRVKIRFGVEDGDGSARSVLCEAAVVRCQKRPDGLFEVGLFFTSLNAADRAAIERLAARGAPVMSR